jgi:predicted transcriptional regulator
MSYFNLVKYDICRHNSAMAPKKPSPLSAAEQAIMDHVWKKQPVGLNDLLADINEARLQPLSRASLQTQLTRLESKGWLRRDDSSRAHLYSAAIAESRGRKSVLGEIKQRLFGGSSLALVRCLVEDGEISDSELAELKKIVNQAHAKPKP